VKCLISFLATLLFPVIGSAAPTGINACVVLSGDTTTVLGYSPCNSASNPPGVSIDTGDVRYTNFLAVQPATLQATVDGLLAAGVAMTFSTTTAASDHYSATAAAIQYYLNVYQDKVTINASATFPVCTSPPTTVALPCPANSNATATSHTMGALAFKDLYANVKAYNAAVIAAQAAAVASQTAPVWPSNAYTSTH
jgi:hypothetical protein